MDAALAERYMTVSAACATHPDRPAQGVCGRCGTFICTGCTVSGDLCGPCRTLLHRDGVPWSDEEKARATARSTLKWSVRAIRLLFATAATGALSLAAARQGAMPAFGERLGWGLLIVAVAAGLGALAGSIRSYKASVAGRPGPAVRGVVPLPTALTIALIGAAPTAMALVVLLLRAD